MREAPAFADAPGRSAPRTRATGASKGKSLSVAARKNRKSSLLGRVFARPGMTFAGVVFAAAMTGIVVNAMMFQKGHHPAPLFGGADRSASDAAKPVPLPIPREVADVAPEPSVAAPVPAADPAPAQPVATPAAKHASNPAVHKKIAASSSVDSIGQFLNKNGGGVGTTARAASKSQANAEHDRVAPKARHRLAAATPPTDR